MQTHPPTSLVDAPPVDDMYDIAYLTKYVGKTDTGIAFTDHAYLDGLARSAYATLVVGNGIAPVYPADGLAYTTSAAEYGRHAPPLHLVNGMGSFVTHLRSGYRGAHRAGHKVAIMHEEPTAFDFYSTDVWNRDHVRDALMSAHDGFVFVSERSRDLWVEEAGLHDSPVHVLPNTCAEEELITAELAGRDRADVAAGLELKPDEVRIVVVGTVQRLKAQLDVLAAVRRLARRRSDVIAHVYLVGRVREAGYAEQIEAFVAANGLDAEVTLVGEVPKRRALDYVAAADVLVIASHTEAMPLVLLEAMLLGTPVVTTPVGGIPEVVDPTCVTYVGVGDVDELACALEHVIDDPAHASELAGAARDRYWAGFSNARFRERFDDVLESMAAEAGLGAASSPSSGRADGLTVVRRPDGVLEVSGSTDGGRGWREAVAVQHAARPLHRVELSLPDAGLVPSLEVVAPLARLGLAVNEIIAPGGRVVCGPDDRTAVMSPADVLRVVGSTEHEAAYAEHVRASARRRAKARTQELAAAAAQPVIAAIASEPPPASVVGRVLGRLPFAPRGRS